jgi:hypothetical protein
MPATEALRPEIADAKPQPSKQRKVALVDNRGYENAIDHESIVGKNLLYRTRSSPICELYSS